MRVLVAHNVSNRFPGGMNRIMQFLHRPLVEAGHEVDFLSREDVPRAAHGRLGRFLYPLLVQRRAARAAAAGRPYDIVNVHEPSSAAVVTQRLSAGNPAVVVTTHGVEQRAWELAAQERRLGRRGPRMVSRLWYPVSSLWQSRLGLRRADHIFCLSFEDRNYLVKRLGIQAARITRVFPGADPCFEVAARNRSYGAARELVFAATWRKNKGIEDLVPAFAALGARHPDLRLTVLGPGFDEHVVRSAFPQTVRDRVRTVSTHSDEETARVLAECDIFVLPSLFEGTPLTLIEAMRSGLPVVTTATCGMKDVVRDAANGLLVPIRSPERLLQAIERLWGDPALRARLGRAAQQDARALYSWPRVAGAVRLAYQRLLERGASSARRTGG